MVHAQAPRQQQILRPHHVVIRVFGEIHAHGITGFRGFTMPDAVGQDDVVRRAVQELSGTEEPAGEGIRQESFAATAGAVQNQYGVHDLPGGIALRLADGEIVQLQFGKGFARREPEISRDPIAFRWIRINGRVRRG